MNQVQVARYRPEMKETLDESFSDLDLLSFDKCGTGRKTGFFQSMKRWWAPSNPEQRTWVLQSYATFPGPKD